MKTVLIFSLLLAAMVAQAAPRKAPVAAQSAARKTSKSKLSKDVRFSGSQVDGKYLSAGESIAEVEGDKEMGALVGVRKNFHDRLKLETARLEKNSSQASAPSGKGN
jgi:hypothetical protein